MYTSIINYINSIARIKTVACVDDQIKDLSAAHYSFIAYVVQHEGDSQDSMVKRLCMDKTTVAHQLSLLEKRGYIKRKYSIMDRRIKNVYPTEKALEAYPLIHNRYKAFTKDCLDGLSEEEKRELERLLDIVYHNAINSMQEG